MAPISRAPFMSWRFCCVHVGTGAMAPPGAAHNKAPRCSDCLFASFPHKPWPVVLAARLAGSALLSRHGAAAAQNQPGAQPRQLQSTRGLPQTAVHIGDCRQARPCSTVEQPTLTRKVDAQVAIRSWPPAGPGVLLPRLHLAPRCLHDRGCEKEWPGADRCPVVLRGWTGCARLAGSQRKRIKR